jgi:Asp-tRNA(Asn)/Glu-tRNA(Gln) amidotransferase A subunit family amidase
MSEGNQSIAQTVAAIAEGHLTSRQWVEHCLERIRENEALGIWSHVDEERALARADEMDWMRKDGSAFGSLHGCPIGLKDIIEVKGMPHGCGSPLMGEISKANASLVDALEAAGAVIIGKTETTEFAFLNPARTKNPHSLEHSPGGSSAGSAAAVASGDVPVTIGSQTNGSIIRPASYCGVFAMKPSAGIIPRTGVFEQSPTLDQMGLFATSLEDLGLVVDALSVHDSRDPHSIAAPRPSCFAGAQAEPPMEPNFAIMTLPYSDLQSHACTEGFREVADSLEGRVEILEAPPTFEQLIEAQRTIHLTEAFRAFDSMGFIGNPQLSEVITKMLAEGQSISQGNYEEALIIRDSLTEFFDNFFEDFDAILSPSSSGDAPLLSEGHTGNPIFCTVWTLAGLPSLNLPILQGESGLPIGIQMIGRRRDDARLLRTARWFMTTLFDEGEG